VIYLLDVNVLLALRYQDHVHHERASHWLESLQPKHGETPALATCAITELGFVRIASRAAGFAPRVAGACLDLVRLKKTGSFCFLPDELGAERLPAWVTKSKQTTDGHLLQLASRYSAVLATLDTGIPGALLIPELPDNANRVSEPSLAYGAAA
jgi:uncharacterized protein